MGLLDFLRSQPEALQPQEGATLTGRSGRAHTNGFLDLEELNNELRHPQGHAVFDKMYRTDGDVRQVIQLCVNPIVCGTWQMEPFGGQEASDQDIEIAEITRWALWDYMRPNLIGHLIEFLPVLFRSGFVPGEILWGVTEYPGQEGSDEKAGAGSISSRQLLAPRKVALRLPRSVLRWNQDDLEELESIEQFLPSWHSSNGQANAAAQAFDTRAGDPRPIQYGGGSMINTVVIPARDLVYYRVGGEGDNWEGQSLLRPAYKHWYMKDHIEKIDAMAQEREAVGIPVVYMPPSATQQQIDDVEAALRQLRTNDVSYLMFPGMKAGEGASDNTGWLFEVLGYDKSGSGRDPTPSLNYHTNKIAAAFIAEFMRLGHGDTGARATAETQADPFQSSIEALVTAIEQQWNDRIVAPFVAYNFKDAKNPPRLKMSLVDSTSLTQLADFVLKLTQVGALLPDQELEDFLRARADLPSANPKSVKERKDDEEQIRRAIVGGNVQPTPAEKAGFGGAANNQDPFGSNADVGKHKNGKPAGSPQRKSGAAKGGAPLGSAGGAGAPRGRGPGKSLSEPWTEEMIAGAVYPSDPVARSWSGLESLLDVDDIARVLDDAPDQMVLTCGDKVRALNSGGGSIADSDELEELILEQLSRMYRTGRDHVCDELGLPREDGSVELRALDNYGLLSERARLASDAVQSVMNHARGMEGLNSGDPARVLAAGERAGLAQLRKVGMGHGSDAYQQGRHDKALDEQDGILGALYTSMLDDNRCGSCGEADDGVVRAMDDPIRLDRRPPNHHCHSTASGHNLCRCLEVYVPMHNEDSRTFAEFQPQGVPEMIRKEAAQMIASRGMDPQRAMTAALAKVRVWARGGGKVSPATRAAASAAIAEWEAQAA